MALMCPSAGCKAKKGPCIHEIGIIVAIVAAAAYFALFR